MTFVSKKALWGLVLLQFQYNMDMKIMQERKVDREKIKKS